jgi:hypothetical protein
VTTIAGDVGSRGEHRIGSSQHVRHGGQMDAYAIFSARKALDRLNQSLDA